MVNMKHREKMVMKHRQSETSSINMVILGIDDGQQIDWGRSAWLLLRMSHGQQWKRRFFKRRLWEFRQRVHKLQRSSRCVMDWLPCTCHGLLWDDWTTGFAEVSSGKSKQQHFPSNPPFGESIGCFLLGPSRAFWSFLGQMWKNHKKPTFVGDFFRETHSIPSHFLGHFSMNWPILSRGEAEPQVMNTSDPILKKRVLMEAM